MKRGILSVLMLLAPLPALAGAWTQGEGEAQLISGAIVSAADRTFGDPTPVSFRRELFQTYAEYGWNDHVTLIAQTEMASVGVAQGTTAPFHATDNAAAAGVRWRWDGLAGWSDLGVFAVQATYRVAGAFNFAVSANRSAGGQGGELRLLYGRNFRVWDRDGFVNTELAETFLTGARANETAADLTAGLWVAQNHMLMLQSFNLFAPAGGLAAYPAFDSHKLQASWLYRWSPRTLFQLGGFFSPMGSNALVEQGVCFSVWERF